jgi:hypothetical protein
LLQSELTLRGSGVDYRSNELADNTTSKFLK